MSVTERGFAWKVNAIVKHIINRIINVQIYRSKETTHRYPWQKITQVDIPYRMGVRRYVLLLNN